MEYYIPMILLGYWVFKRRDVSAASRKKYNNQIIAAASSSPPAQHTHTLAHMGSQSPHTQLQLSIKSKHRVAAS